MDEAILAGKIDRTIPWIKSNVVAVLTADYSTEEEAVQRISSRLKELYRAEGRVEPAIAAAQTIFKQNFFPEMKADSRATLITLVTNNGPGFAAVTMASTKAPKAG